MSASMTVDAARLELLLSELRLPSMKAIWPKLAAQSDKEGWPAAKFLAALAEHEAADRGRRRFERHLADARLPPGKTLASFDFEAAPMLSKAQVMALTAGDVWLKTGANVLIFGPPGAGKSHLSAAIGLASSRMAGVSCSRVQPTSSNACRLHDASSPSKPPSPSSTNTTC